MVKVYGSSDDLIEVEGDVSEEFNHYSGDDAEPRFLAFSDGTVLRIAYEKDGCWRSSPVAKGSAVYAHEPAIDSEGDNYSDVATLDGDVRWVVFGKQFVTKPKKRA